MHPDFVFPFYSFLVPHFTCTHAILILLFSDSFSSYLTTISCILLPNQRTANARFEPSPRASRTTPGIDSKWIGHPSSALSGAALISLYVFAYLPDDLLDAGSILAAAFSRTHLHMGVAYLFAPDSFYVTFPFVSYRQVNRQFYSDSLSCAP
jgi:hypothetical protein